MAADTLRLLIVDDDPSFLDMSKLMMENIGSVEVTTTTDAQGVPSMVPNGYDVIVSDFEMGEYSGLDLLREVKGRCDIPFILLTGRGREEIAIEALNGGADMYLQKGMHARSMFEELISHAKRLRSDKLRRRELEMAWAIVDRAPEEVFLVDEDGIIRYINRTASKALGYEPKDIVGRMVHDVDPDFGTHDYVGQWRTLRAKGNDRLLSRHRSKDGRTYPVDISINHLEIDGQEFNCAFARDLTPIADLLGLGDTLLDGFRAAFNVAPIPMAIVIEGRMRDANWAMLDAIRVDEGELSEEEVPMTPGRMELRGKVFMIVPLDVEGTMFMFEPSA